MAAENSISWNRRILINEEAQLDFMLNSGLVKDAKLSMPYRTRLTYDNSNLFLRISEFEVRKIRIYNFSFSLQTLKRFSNYQINLITPGNNLFGYLKEGEHVKQAISVNVYDKGGHEFQMMLKKWDKYGFYVLNRGWASFCDQHRLGKDDFIAIRTFRHGITDMLCFIVTYKRMRSENYKVLFY